MDIHCSPIGIIPKKSKPGKWRLIVDLSSPTDASVNNGINKELCSLSYTSVDNIANEIIAKGVGTLMAKIGHQAGLPNGPGTPGRSQAVRNEMGRKNIR